MHKIGEHIMYGGAVMRIANIGAVDFAPGDREYYALEDASAAGASKTYVPTDNELLVGMMRPVMSKAEINRVLASYAQIPALEWKNENKARGDSFRKVIESQDASAMLGMIKAIDAVSRARQAEGKKSYITDMNALARAKKILACEIAYVMKITEAEAQELLAHALMQNA